MRKRIVALLIICLVATQLTLYGAPLQKVFISGVPVINQHPELPTGCEATALTMLLQYNGIKVSKAQVAEAIPKAPVQGWTKGRYIGGNPREGFIGSPYSKSGYGVYMEPILKTIERYIPGRAVDLKGKPFDELLGYVDKGQPVMIWATIGMSNVGRGPSWQLSDGSTFRWPSGEHAVVIVGYDEKNVYVNDPYVGKVRAYRRAVVANRYRTLGSQAITIKQGPKAFKTTILGNKTSQAQLEVIGYKDKNSVYVPLRNLETIIPGLTYTYQDKKVTVNCKDMSSTIDLSKLEGRVGIGDILEVPYIREQNTLFIDIVPLKTTYNLSITLTEGKMITIKVKENVTPLQEDSNQQ